MRSANVCFIGIQIAYLLLMLSLLEHAITALKERSMSVLMKESMIDKLIDYFQSDNPNFDKEKFLSFIK